MDIFRLNELSKTIHIENAKWWHTKDGVRLDRNKGELIMLFVTELAEATEGVRKSLKDDKLPLRLMEEVEMSDVVIRALDYAGGFNLPILQVGVPLFTDNKAECLLKLTDVACAIYAAACDGNPDYEAKMLSGLILGCYAYCEKFGLDLDGAMTEKREFNKVRVDHTYAAREAAGGKAF